MWVILVLDRKRGYRWQWYLRDIHLACKKIRWHITNEFCSLCQNIETHLLWLQTKHENCNLLRREVRKTELICATKLHKTTPKETIEEGVNLALTVFPETQLQIQFHCHSSRYTQHHLKTGKLKDLQYLSFHNVNTLEKINKNQTLKKLGVGIEYKIKINDNSYIIVYPDYFVFIHENNKQNNSTNLRSCISFFYSGCEERASSHKWTNLYSHQSWDSQCLFGKTCGPEHNISLI